MIQETEKITDQAVSEDARGIGTLRYMCGGNEPSQE